MSSFLLDEQISPRVAEEAVKLGIDVAAVAKSPLAGRDDETIFREAVKLKRILVTYDVGDFSGIYGDLLKEGVRIEGLVFVDRRTIPGSDIGGLARALVKLAKAVGKGEIDPTCVFLHR